MRLDDLGVSAKVWGAILLLLGAMLLVSGLTLHRAYAIQEAASARVDHARDLVERSIVWKGMTESATNRGMVIAISADAQVEAFFREASTEDAARIGKLREGITRDATSEADRLHLKKIAALGIQLLAVSKKARHADPQLGRAGAAALVRDEYRPVQQQYVLEIERFVALQKAKEAEAKRGASQARRTALSLGALAALIVVAIAALAAAWLVRSIKQPLARVIGLAKTIATGDLTSHVEAFRRDEFGELMHAIAAMNASLNRVVGQVRRSADGIATASMQIAAGNLDLSARTEQTASSLQQTAASMQHLTSTVRSNADAAQRANQLAASATRAALEGGDMVGRVVATMGEITGASQKIASIIGVIDGIAFQTNILALNAAVEAAQAGEQGRGFAVVAGEVRSLAQRSADAAKEIRGLIGSNSEKIEAGAALVATTGTAMEAIVDAIARVAKILDEIVLASNEQTTGITQVNQAVAHLDEMTQRNAALVEEGAAAASSMRDQAVQMTRIVETFRVTQAA